MRIIRSYPQPDSSEPHIGPRERALAVFKYLLGVEPEQAKDHPLFACIENSYRQSEKRGLFIGEGIEECLDQLQPSLVPMLTSTRELAPRPEPVDEGKL